MEIVFILFMVFVVVILFILLGIGGWIFEIVGSIFNFLLEGVTKSIGCLFGIIIFIVLFFIFLGLIG